MSKQCIIGSTESYIDNFLNERIDSSNPNTLNLSGDDFLAQVHNEFSDNVLALNILKRKLNDLDIYTFDHDLDDQISMVTKSQLYEGYKSWNLKSSDSIIRIFKSNSTLYSKIEGKFIEDAFKYCVVNNNIYADKSLVQNSEDLVQNITEFKQELIHHLLENLDLVDEDGNLLDEDTVVFDLEYGADGQLYDTIMEASKDLLRDYGLTELSDGTFDVASVDPNDKTIVDVLYTIFALNNFDTLLDKTLEGIVEKGKRGQSGDLNRIEYSLNRSVNQDLNDAQIIADDARSNAMSFITPTIDLIIQNIPVVRFSKTSDTPLSLDKQGKTLSAPDVLQLSQFLQLYISDFKDLFQLEDVDFQKNPINSLEKILKAIHDNVLNYSKLRKSKDPVKQFLDKNSEKQEISTALSLYEYLFKDTDRLKVNTRSINNINLEFDGIPPFNIINEIILQMTQVTAPAYFEHDLDGLLYTESDRDTTSKKCIQRFRNNKASFSFKNAVTFAVYTEGRRATKKSKLSDAILSVKSSTSLKSALKNKDYLDAAKRLFGLSSIDDSIATQLLLEMDSEVVGFSVSETLKELAEIINNLEPDADPYQYWLQVQTALKPITDNSTIDRETIGNILSPVLDSGVNPVFMTSQGNLQGVFRTTSLVFLHDHCIKRYKRLEGAESENSSDYKPIRERSSILVDNPDLLRPGTNKAYLSQVGLPLYMGIKGQAVEAQKQTEFNQDLRQFVGEYLSLLTGVKNHEASPTFAFQLGTYSDKSSLPELIINARTKLKGGVPVIDLLRNRELLLHYTQAYESTRMLDLVNNVVSDWRTILLQAASMSQEQVASIKSPDARNFVLNLQSRIQDIANIATIDLLSDEQGSHSELFKAWLESPEDAIAFQDLMGAVSRNGRSLTPKENSVWNLKEILLQSAEELNQILGEDLTGFKAFKSELVPQLGEQLNVQIVEELHGGVYDKNHFELNRVLLDDLKKLCTIQTFKSLGTKDGFVPSTELKQDSNYYQQMVEKALSKELNLKTGTPTSFYKYLEEYFSEPEHMETIYKMTQQAKVKSPVTIFKSLISYDKKTNKYSLNKDKLVEIYTNYILATNFFRHQALEIGVKEAYEDKAKNTKTIEDERSSRLSTTTKRNNTYTATIMPFIMDLVNGVSHKTRVCMIADVPGGVMNTIGMDSNVTEYDGLAQLSPIQVRMEDVSLNKTHRVSTKKTFITTVGDYFSGEFKWATNEITNKKIRESIGCKVSMLSVFKRMHNRKFEHPIDITAFWKNGGNPTAVYFNSLIGQDLYAREGFKYYKYVSIKSSGNNDNTYTVQRQEVDSTGKFIQNDTPYTITINNLFDIYSNLGGQNAMELTSSKLEYSENIMDVLSQFVINCGDFKRDLKGDQISNEVSQSNIDQPLRDYFVGILATEGSNKRGIANMVSGQAWYDDDIPLSSYHVEIATGGEQLSAEHEATDSEITKGTQLMQVLTQKGYTAELVENLYKSIAQVMDISSPKYNEMMTLLEQGDVALLSSNISQKIVNDLELTGLTEGISNLISRFKEETDSLNSSRNEDEQEPFTLPLSLMVKEVIKSYAPELNKNVIKQQDSGLMGTLNGASGFIQNYTIKGVTYPNAEFFKEKNLNQWKPYTYDILQFCESTGIDFNEVIRVLSVISLNGDLDSAETYFRVNSQYNIGTDSPEHIPWFRSLLDVVMDPNIRRIRALSYFSVNRDATSFLGYDKIPVSKLQPGMTIIHPLTYEPIVVDSINKILTYSESNEYAFVETMTPSDLKPQVLEITTQNGNVENEYTSFESILGAKISRIAEGSNIESDWTTLSDLLDYLTRVDTKYQYRNLRKAIANRTLTDSEIKELFEIQEDLSNFKNHVKSLGFTLSDLTDFDTYYQGFNPREFFEHQLQRKIIENKLSEDFELLKNQFAFYVRNQAKESQKPYLTQILRNNQQLVKFISEHPEFVFKALPYTKNQEYNNYLSQLGFDKIVSTNLSQAQIIMPLIYRGQMKIGNIDILDVDVNSFTKAPTFYRVPDYYKTEDEKINVDFVVRGFRGQYGIMAADDISDNQLSIYGESIKDRLIIDEEGYRLNPRTKQRMYKLPTVPFDIRRNGKQETLIIKNSKDVINDVYTLLNSDSSLVSVQPFLYNILNNTKSDYNKLNEVLQNIGTLNTVPAFENSFQEIDGLLSLNQSIIHKERISDLLNTLNDYYIHNESTYKDRLRNSMFVSFLRSLDVIATRIPTQNMSSVMTMKIAAFTKSDINDVFVTKWQQWLQGSDYD